MPQPHDEAPVWRLLRDPSDAPPVFVRFERRPLRGGISAPNVEHITARFEDAHGRRRSFCFVRKVLEAESVREAHVYARVLSTLEDVCAPRLLEVVHGGPERAELYLEAVPKRQAWPWRDTSVASRVLVQVARFHHAADLHGVELTWDYEAELASQAVATVELLERCRRDPDFVTLRAYVAPMRRLVRSLPAWRRELLGHSVGTAPLHGDLHPGNVIVRSSGGSSAPVLLDWARARMGSPFEDVSSWLQSLGFWEPEVKRRHDTLLASYLVARGQRPVLSSDVRDAYWLAGASNALAGALHHHLATARAATRASSRAAATRAARDWLRVVRRADAVWS